MREASYDSWGSLHRHDRRAIDAATFSETAATGARRNGSLLPFGNGRSYGDSCLNDEGVLIDSRASARIRSFDAESGILSADAGVLLCDITRHVAPAGWFLPVTPGTQFITLGGAIANDVHGKNHHRRGTFGRWVDEIELERSDLGRLICSPEEHAELFKATISGMGLTGLIRSATIRLLKVPSLSIEQTTTRFDRLADFFDLAEEADTRHEYVVAWIDSLSKGSSFGRGHLVAGDHAPQGDRAGQARPAMFNIPVRPPVSPLSGLNLAAFNTAYFRRTSRGTSRRIVPFDSFFYPLDRVRNWNRLYGSRGLHQHQSVFPTNDALAVATELLATARTFKQGSFLTVLKRFGSVQSPGLTSFPRSGYTLTLDFPHRGEPTLSLLARLDRIVTEAGGAVNPYKDSRMSPAVFAAGFQAWRELECRRDPRIQSDFWRRTAMLLADEDPSNA